MSNYFKSWFIVIQLNEPQKKIALLLVSIVDIALHFSLVLGRYKHWSLSRKTITAVAYRILMQIPSCLLILCLLITVLEMDFVADIADLSQRPIYSQLLSLRK